MSKDPTKHKYDNSDFIKLSEYNDITTRCDDLKSINADLRERISKQGRQINDYEIVLNKIEEAERMGYGIGISFGEYARKVLEKWK